MNKEPLAKEIYNISNIWSEFWLRSGISATESLDIHPYMLSRWRKVYREGIIVGDKRKKSHYLSQGRNLVELQSLSVKMNRWSWRMIC